MKIMKATSDILPQIETALPTIVETMQAMNNPQWSTKYPKTFDFTNDIEQGNLFCFIENDEVIGIAAFLCKYDAWFYDGEHQNKIIPENEEVLYVHRIFVFPQFSGRHLAQKIYSTIIDYAQKQKKLAVQVDTHENNVPMNKTLIRSGFSYTGSHGREGRQGLWNMYEYVI